MITELNRALEDRFGELSKTLFFEHDSLEEIADHLAETKPEALRPAPAEEPATEAAPAVEPARRPRFMTSVRVETPDQGPDQDPEHGPDHDTSDDAVEHDAVEDDAIAVIGLSGRYPMADDLGEFWENLAEGRDCVTEVPRERWDHERFFDADASRAGGTYGKWGGFLSDVDKFDPLFFSVSPREAELMDPQERLFLQSAWHVLEDAGYRARTLGRRQVGVFVGVMYGEYQLYGAVDALRGTGPVTESSYSLIANRVSYLLDLHGPSLAVDTMCSSSLTALHLACESLRHGESELAIAGGVNVSVHPYKYVLLSQSKFLSTDGRCRSFGAGGSGYVPGEGVGAVLLKPLARAIEDGDHVYGVIRGTAVNHGGRPSGSGYTVPNPRAQERVIAAAWGRAGVEPGSVSYVEAHGTGTSLGDPIEITGLRRAFGGAEGVGAAGVCAIGSVKSNIGHLESAAGIAGLTKVLLQLKHGRLVPSLHAGELNPQIDFAASGFRVQRESGEWPVRVVEGVVVPRRAGVSSFGAGGSNAHVVVEEFTGAGAGAGAGVGVELVAGAQRVGDPLVFVVSARDEERLREYAGRLGAFLERERVALADVAYTLHTGREPMTERLALVTADGAELVRVLREFANGGDPEGLLRGSVAPDRAPEAPQPTDDPHTAAAQWARGDTDDVAGRWTDGRRTPLPGYPFARERHWIATAAGTLPGGTPALHPLLDANDSTVEEQRFRKTLRATDPLLRDHVIAGQPVLAAAAALELVRAGAERASRRPLRGLSDVVWGRPVTVPAGRAEIELYAAFTADGERIAFEVYSEADGARTTHLRGQARYGAPAAEQADRTDLAAVRERCTGRRTGAEVYRDYAGVGFAYGDSFRVIQDVRIGRTEALAELALPAGAGHGCTLAPQLLDGALRACHWIDREQAPRAEELAVPFGVGALTVHGELPPVCYAHAEVLGRGERRDTWRYRVTVLDPEGRVLARVEDLVGRLFAAADVPESPADAPDTPAGAPAPQPVRTAGRAAEELFYRPVWHDAPAPRAGRADRAPLLVLTDRAGTAAELAAAGGWRQAVEVLPGAGFERRAADRYVLDPAEPEHYRRLLRELAADLPGVSRAGLDVAHLWSTEAPDGGPQDAVEGDLAALHRRREEVFGRGLGSVLHLVRAVTDAGVDGRVRCLYLHSGRGAAGVPEHEAVAGLALSTARHAPGIELFTVRHDPARDGALPAAVLAAELTADGALRGAEVRYEAGRRSVRTVERATRPATPADGAAPLVEGGAYLITGGAGGVGRLLARYLAARYRARLVLLGRSPLPEAVRAELEELGAQVLGVRADVADAGQLRAALIEARGRFGGLDGVFHLAGVADRVPLTEVDDAGFRRALAAKVQGVVNLDVLTRADRLGVFAAFSSVSALCGDFGAGSYAAANRFLDAYLAVRDGRVASGERTGRTLSLDWPLWDAGGVDALVQDGELDTYQEATGMLRMTPRQALDAFDRAWQFDAPVLVPVLGDPERIARTLGGAAVPPAATRAGASTEPAPPPG
ncbi:beta-ketoacyl synthase [Streptomyces noursei]|nr:beta-ketoacyl synthase [Streptomyces noursei]